MHPAEPGNRGAWELMVVNQALAKMRGGEPAFGYALEMGSPVAAEVLAESGVDFLMVDTQHGSYNNPESTAFMRAHFSEIRGRRPDAVAHR